MSSRNNRLNKPATMHKRRGDAINSKYKVCPAKFKKVKSTIWANP